MSPLLALLGLSLAAGPALAAQPACLGTDVVACLDEAAEIMEMFEGACEAGSARACLRAAQFHGSESWGLRQANLSIAALERCAQGGSCIRERTLVVLGPERWEVDDTVVYTARKGELDDRGLPVESLATGPVYDTLQEALRVRQEEGAEAAALHLTEDLPTEALERVLATAREAGLELASVRQGEAVAVLSLRDPGERAAPPEVAGPPPGEGEAIRYGALDKGLIEAGVQKQMRKLRYCYQRELSKDHSLAGQVVIDPSTSRPRAARRRRARGRQRPWRRVR